MVAPVTPPSTRSDFPQSIDSMLAGLGTKVAQTALAKSQILAKLPPAHQLALRQALVAASETHKEAEAAQGELVKLRKKLQDAEKDLFEKAEVSCRQSVDAEARSAALRVDLVAAHSANAAIAARLRTRRIYSWLALCVGLATAIAGTFLLPSRVSRWPGFSSSTGALVAKSGRSEKDSGAGSPISRPYVKATVGADYPYSEALDRLTADLANIPSADLPNVMRAANLWLVAEGAPPCTVPEAEETDTSLLVAGLKLKVIPERPLGEAMARCIEGVEHIRR